MLIALLACTGKPPSIVDTGTPPRGDPLVRFEGEPPRNVLMISVDTLRRDHVTAEHMPWLTSWLAGAVWLQDHQQCSSWTFASTVCTLNGINNEENAFLPKLSEDLREPVPDGQETLAVHLQRAGFETFLVTSNGWLSDDWNNAQGYEHTEPPIAGTITVLSRLGLDQVLAEAPDRWLLHVHAIEPHVPYDPPDEYLQGVPDIPWDVTTQPAHYDTTAQWPILSGDDQALLEEHLRARYAADVRFLDDQLENLFRDLEAEGFLDDTLVVLWTDHGEQFWEHGHQSHAYGLAAEENDALLAFWARDLPPVAWDGPTHATDLLPTVLDALGLPPPERTSGEVVGTALRSRLRFAAVSARQGTVQAVTRRGYKLQYNWNGTLKLWHRASDRAELIDVASREPERVAELWAILHPHVLLLQPLVPERTLVWPELP